MNCLEFRRLCMSDPSIEDADFLGHRRQCRACAEFYRKTESFERTLHQALAVTVPEGLAAHVILRRSIAAGRGARLRQSVYLAMAASMLLAIGLVLGLAYAPRSERLTDVALEYFNREAALPQVASPVAPQAVAALLSEFGIAVQGDLGAVKVAERCKVKKGRGAHLVLSGARGPVTLLFMPEEPIEQRTQFNDGYYRGLIIPCPRGSMAIVGSAGEDVDGIERRLHDVLVWI